MTTPNDIDEILALVKYSVEYEDTHGGCPPAVKAIKRHGVAEAKQAINRYTQRKCLEARIEALIAVQNTLVSQPKNVTEPYLLLRIDILQQQLEGL